MLKCAPLPRETLQDRSSDLHVREPDRGFFRANPHLVDNASSHRSKEREGPGGEMLRHLGRKSAENEALSVTPSGG